MTKRVLVCDDSVLMRKMVVDCLSNDGWEIVDEAANGEEAVRMYSEHLPDVVTMDIVMPGMDGLTALSEIKSTYPNANIVMLSAINQTKCISDAIRAGADDFIVKPFLPEQLQETVNRGIAVSV